MSENEAGATIPMDDLSDVDLEQLKQSYDWTQKYRLITQWSGLISEKNELRHDKNLIKGCEAKAWMNVILVDEHYYFLFDSDSRIVKGLAAILLTILNNKTAEQLANVSSHDLLAELGLAQRLTPSRSNAFYAVVKQALALVKMS